MLALTPSPFIPQSDHAKAIAARAEAETAALIERRKTATGSEKKNLAGLRNMVETRSSSPRVNPYKIKVRPGFNARIFDSAEAIEDDENLLRSIKAKGVLDSHPLEVDIGEDGVTLWLVDGERRLRATLRAINEGCKIESVPVKTVPAGSDEADLVASQLMHNSGRRYGPLELGTIVKKLLGYGWSHEKIEAETGTPVARQKDALGIAALPVEAKAAIKAGNGSASFVAKTIAAHGKDAGLAKIKEASAKAAASGRTRAMPRDLGEQTDRRFLREVFAGATVARDVSGEVTITFSGEAFAALAMRFGISE